MKPISKFAIAFVLVVIPQVSYSLCYYCNRGDWNQMSAGNKHGFVAGVLQDMTIHIVGVDNSYSEDLTKCLIELGLNTNDLVDVVENQYQDLKKWELPPEIVLSMGLRNVCLPFINRARVARGDEPLEP